MSIKLWIDEEELWPFYSEDTDGHPDGHFGWEIELTKAEAADFRDVMFRFYEWQERLENCIKAQRK